VQQKPAVGNNNKNDNDSAICAPTEVFEYCSACSLKAKVLFIFVCSSFFGTHLVAIDRFAIDERSVPRILYFSRSLLFLFFYFPWMILAVP